MKSPDQPTQSSGVGSATLDCVQDTASFKSLQSEWQLLYSVCPYATPFNSWEWLFSWWQSYGAHRRLQILTWRSGSSLLGIAPLYLSSEKTGLGAGCRVLRFVGDGSHDSDYLGMLIRPDLVTSIVQQFAKWLRVSREWDVLVLREMSTRSGMAEVLKQEIENLGFRTRVENSRTATLPLPPSFDDFLTGRRSRFRTKLRSLLKTLDQGALTFETRCERPLELRHRLRSLFTLHQRRWMEVGGSGVFGDAEKRLFYRRFVLRFARRGWLRFYSLRQGSEYVAHQLCFGSEGTTYLLQEGFDLANATASYGQMLRAAVMRHLIANAESTYDFLGGFSKHKEEWGAREENSIHLLAARLNWRARLYFDLPIWRERIAGSAKRVLPAAMIKRLRRMFNV